MIQDIAPHTYHNEYRPVAPDGSSFVLAYENGKSFFHKNDTDNSITLPRFRELEGNVSDLYKNYIYLFSIDDERFYLIPGLDTSLLPGYEFHENRELRYVQPQYLLLLNNDTEVITPGWLEEMVMYAQQKRVGCVGAKLLYPDDTIQHAGVGFGIGGVAGHLHKYFPATSDGYMGRPNYVQDVYGDTAACLLIRKEIYDEVHGLDESYAVAFNDVDFCVRVREAGYTNVFTPFAQLYHYESKSRGMEDNPEKQKRFQGEVLRFQARWGDLLAKGDPCTNPNFDIQREDFSLKILPLE